MREPPVIVITGGSIAWIILELKYFFVLKVVKIHKFKILNLNGKNDNINSALSTKLKLLINVLLNTLL